VPGRLAVVADVDFAVEVPGRDPLTGSLRGHGRRLELRVSDPGAFAGRADSAALRSLAASLAERGLSVTVVAGDRALLSLGKVRTTWLQRRLTGSRHLRVAGALGAWTGARARTRPGRQAVLPDRSLAPPAMLWPPAPTFLRGRRDPVTTTHGPRGGGDPRMVLAPRGDLWPGDRQPVYPLRRAVTTIGSDASCDIRLPGLAPFQAEVRHDADDEFVLVHVGGPGAPTRLHGEAVRQRILRTASRVDLGGWTMTYYREEYADHGRPYGGRVGGELGRQRPQPTWERMARPDAG